MRKISNSASGMKSGGTITVKTWGPDENDNRYKKQKVRKIRVLELYQHFVLCINEHGYRECFSYGELGRNI